jgi:extradiol dioxygenase family protein
LPVVQVKHTVCRASGWYKPGEQATLFFLDPFGNAIEFKAFQNPQSLFAK